MRTDNKIPGAQAPKTGTVVHNVHILDASGSMAGDKYVNALAGINKELNALKAESHGNVITNTVVEFSGPEYTFGKEAGTIKEHHFMVPAANCSMVAGKGASGGTPLYQAVGETIEKLVSRTNAGEKVILTIFTDGDENTSQGIYKNPETLKKLIKQVEDNHNFTVTFMGTEGDVFKVVKNLGVHASNTLAHLNTADSIGATYSARGASVMNYSKNVASGVSQVKLRRGFFKNVADEETEKTDN